MAPKRAPPPTSVESSEQTDSGCTTTDDEEGEEDEEEEEAEKEEEKEAVELEEEEEEEDVVPQVKSDGDGVKPPPNKDKKLFQRGRSKADEILILEAHVTYLKEHGELPMPQQLQATLSGELKGHRVMKEVTKELMELIKMQ